MPDPTFIAVRSLVDFDLPDGTSARVVCVKAADYRPGDRLVVVNADGGVVECMGTVDLVDGPRDRRPVWRGSDGKVAVVGPGTANAVADCPGWRPGMRLEVRRA